MTNLDSERQAITELMDLIRTGELPPDSILPAEDELSTRLKCPPVIVRRAVERLNRSGMLVVEESAGNKRTVVRDPAETDILWLRPGDSAERHNGDLVVTDASGTIRKYPEKSIQIIAASPLTGS